MFAYIKFLTQELSSHVIKPHDKDYMLTFSTMTEVRPTMPLALYCIQKYR